jgi:glycosyltransferase involved in cell wall biosynthesis
MNEKGHEFLNHNLNILKNQTFKDFNIIISDHSTNENIKELCDNWNQELDIIYIKNEKNRGSSSANLNNGIKNANGDYIKIIFQDDFLYTNESLSELYNHIINNDNFWYVTSSQHSNDGIIFHMEHSPHWNNDMYKGNNTFSSPSILTIKNDANKMFFDEELIWLMDVEYYKRMYDKYGEPSYLRRVNVVNRVWNGSVSYTLHPEIKNKEVEKMIQRYS